MERYLEQVAYLHTGKGTMPKSATDSLSIKTLCNLYLEHQESRAEIGEIKLRYVYDQISLFVNGGVKVSHLAEQKYTTHSLYSRDRPGCQYSILASSFLLSG
jgi:hypothetical protein